MSQILDKIRKLLALSKSDNANEAAAAAGAAQRLMQEHRIAEAELEGDSEPQERASLATDPIDTFGEQAPIWKGSLCNGLTKLHGCECWTSSKRDGARVVRCMLIVGRPSDVASVRYLYAWLVSEIERLAQRHAMGKGRTFANSYRMGAVAGCLEAMRGANRDVRAKATGEALVRIDARALESQSVLGSLGLNLRQRSTSARLKRDAYERGQAAGRGLHSGAKLGASTGARLLGSGR